MNKTYEKSTRYQLYERLDGPQSRPGGRGELKILYRVIALIKTAKQFFLILSCLTVTDIKW
jgi:hypothetical protein